MAKFQIFDKINLELPRGSLITDTCFEGANIVLYTKNKDFFIQSKSIVARIVNKIKKRVEVRADESILLNQKDAEELIKNIVPGEAGLKNIWFDPKRSLILLEAEKPGIVIGKKGGVIKEIKRKTFWKPEIRRCPVLKSDLVNSIRRTLFKYSDYRRKFLNKLGQRIYAPWERNGKYWIRLSFLGGAREVGRSCFLLQTPESKVLLDCGVNVASDENAFPYLDSPEMNIKDLDAIVVTHAHLDHCGMIPYLLKFGYKGPIYSTEATRDIMTLLQLDYVDITQKEGKKIIYSSKDIKEMIKHSIALDYEEVTDITPDVRLTLFNAGHILGSSMVHLNIGNAYHNLLYSGDFKFAATKSFESAVHKFKRCETLVMESTYGGKEDIQPSRQECEMEMVKIITDTINNNGKVLIPTLGVGRAQDVMLMIEELIRTKKIKEIPVFVDGMVWDVTAIYTTYPEFMSPSIRRLIFSKNKNPFLSPILRRVGSQKERMEIIEKTGPCVILATSGMLVGGPSVEYLYHLCDNPRNSLVFVSYQGEGSLGRKIERGEREIPVIRGRRKELMKINMNVYSISGLSGHSDKNQLVNFVRKLEPKPRRILVIHGESSKSLNLASSLHKMLRVETMAPRNLDALRIR